MSQKQFTDKVSVIIPAFNCEATLDRAVRSVLNQSYSNLELIIIDDNSEKPIKFYSNKLTRVFRNPKNRGAAYSRNKAARLADGRFIAFLDADDYWHPDKLKRQLQRLNEIKKNSKNLQRNFAIVSGVNILKNNNLHARPRIPINYQELEYTISGVWFFPGSTLLIERDFFTALGGFDDNFRRLEDYEFFLRFHQYNGKLVMVEEALSYIERQPHANLTDVVKSCKKIFYKHWRLAKTVRLKRYMLGYLFLEIGATAYYSGKILIGITALLLSFGLVPRASPQLKTWWH